jgi:hypothetical protein
MKGALILGVLMASLVILPDQVPAQSMHAPPRAVAPAQPSAPQSLIVCSEDIVPNDMIVTATGTSPACRGSCRARKVAPVRGLVMIVCANQPIPERYVLDSVTTTPDCVCLGDEDNAYVIKLNQSHENDEEVFPTATPIPSPGTEASPKLPDFRTGD